MLRELHLDEILFEPPPKRPPPELPPESPFEDDFPADPEFLNLPLPPPLPDRPWTRYEAAERVLEMLKEFPNPDDLIDYFRDLDYTLLDDIGMTTGEMLCDKDFDFILPTLALMVLCFSPRGTQPPDIDLDELEARFDSEVET